MRFALIAWLLIAPLGPAQVKGQEAPTIVSHIRRVPVTSTVIARIGYSRRLHALEIQFHNGAVYRYLDVPIDLYRELMESPSKASYYDSSIRRHYRSLDVKTTTETQIE